MIPDTPNHTRWYLVNQTIPDIPNQTTWIRKSWNYWDIELCLNDTTMYVHDAQTKPSDKSRMFSQIQWENIKVWLKQHNIKTRQNLRTRQHSILINVYLLFSQTFSKDKPSCFILFQLSNLHNMFRLTPCSHGIWRLTDKDKWQHQKTSIQNSLFVTTSLSLSAKKVKLCLHKTSQVQKRPPLRGVVLPLAPWHAPPLLPPPLGHHLLCHKDMLPQTKVSRSVWVCSYCLRPSLRGSQRNTVPSSLVQTLGLSELNFESCGNKVWIELNMVGWVQFSSIPTL